eukprot:1937850-Prymnesium_polylepis.3
MRMRSGSTIQANTDKFIRAAAVGNKVVFGAHDSEYVRVYDVSTGTFDASVPIGSIGVNNGYFYGAAAVGTQVVFAPYRADRVGVYDASTSAFDASVTTGTLGLAQKFRGVAAAGTKVVFAPYKADVVGVYDVSTSTFDASVSTGTITSDRHAVACSCAGPCNCTILLLLCVAIACVRALCAAAHSKMRALHRKRRRTARRDAGRKTRALSQNGRMPRPRS